MMSLTERKALSIPEYLIEAMDCCHSINLSSNSWGNGTGFKLHGRSLHGTKRGKPCLYLDQPSCTYDVHRTSHTLLTGYETDTATAQFTISLSFCLESAESAERLLMGIETSNCRNRISISQHNAADGGYVWTSRQDHIAGAPGNWVYGQRFYSIRHPSKCLSIGLSLDLGLSL